MKTKCGIAPLLLDPEDKDSLKFDDKEKANILQDQFFSVFTQESCSNIPRLPPRTLSTISDVHITKEMVTTLFEALNVNKSVGPDGMHPKLLKELAVHITEPITQLFNMTIEENALPNDWKKAFVSPIFNKHGFTWTQPERIWNDIG